MNGREETAACCGGRSLAANMDHYNIRVEVALWLEEVPAEPFQQIDKMHSRVASGEDCGIPVQTAVDSRRQSRSTLRGKLRHSSGSGCKETPFLAVHPPATMLSANRSQQALPALEICPRSRSASSGAAATNPPPARYMAPRSRCRLPSGDGYYPRCKTISLPASAILPQSAPRSPLPLRTSSDSRHAWREQTTIPHRSAMRAPPTLGSAQSDANSACPHKKRMK